MSTIAEDELAFTLGSSRRVDLRQAERELQELWHTAGDEARRRGAEGVLRLRELNLVVYAEGEEMADRISAVIARLSQRHPSRAIVLLDAGLGEGGVELVEAWVSAACYRTREGGRHVCWEQVTVPARGEATGLLHTAAMRLMVPELPTVLWWPGEPRLRGHTFNKLGEVSDFVLVDSAGFSDPLAGILALSEVVADRSRNFDLEDLNWSRLTPWREVTAELFDDPMRVSWLERIDRVVVEYGSEDTYERPKRALEPAAARALLFVAWLASRLGWRLEHDQWESGDGSLSTRLRRAAAQVPDTIEIVLVPGQTPCDVPGGLIAVRLHVGPVVVSVARMDEACVCAARVKRGAADDELVRTVDVSPRPEDRLLSDELDLLGADPVYEDALMMAAALVSLRGQGSSGVAKGGLFMLRETNGGGEGGPAEKILLDADQLRRTLTRIAHEIAEHSPELSDLALVGIQRRGVELAERLAGLLAEYYGSRPPTGAIDITFYRDDIDTRISRPAYDQPVVHSTTLPFDVQGRTLVLVDDVLFTGRTIRAAIEALFDYGRPSAVRLAVLVDRGHRELPIRPDFVGKNVPTSRNERITVRLVELDGLDEVALQRDFAPD